MAFPNVNILLQNGQLGGLIQFAEGVAGLICTGVAVSGKIGIGDPRLVFKLQDAIDIGITTADNPFAYKHVKEFYDEAGEGAELYLMLAPDTMEQTEMLDVSNTSGVVKLFDYAQGRIRLLGSAFKAPVGYTLDVSAGLDADVFTAITKAQALGEAYASQVKPFRAVLDGNSYSGVAANLTDLKTLTANRVAVNMAGTDNTKKTSVGLLLGRLAKISVQRKLSRVKDGAINATAMYIGDTLAEAVSAAANIHDKGYIVPRVFPSGLSGYYYSGDHTCAPDTDDYCFLARGRVIDKAHILTYGTLVQELDDDVEINPDGTLSIGLIKYLEKKVENQIAENMAGEISSVDCVINPNQNILSTNKLVAAVQIIGKGYMTTIEVPLGFTNPALQ